MIDDPAGLHNYWSADYHDTFPDEALEIFRGTALSGNQPSPSSSSCRGVE